MVLIPQRGVVTITFNITARQYSHLIFFFFFWFGVKNHSDTPDTHSAKL